MTTAILTDGKLYTYDVRNWPCLICLLV